MCNCSNFSTSICPKQVLRESKDMKMINISKAIAEILYLSLTNKNIFKINPHIL